MLVGRGYCGKHWGKYGGLYNDYGKKYMKPSKVIIIREPYFYYIESEWTYKTIRKKIMSGVKLVSRGEFDLNGFNTYLLNYSKSTGINLEAFIGEKSIIGIREINTNQA